MYCINGLRIKRPNETYIDAYVKPSAILERAFLWCGHLSQLILKILNKNKIMYMYVLMNNKHTVFIYKKTQAFLMTCFMFMLPQIVCVHSQGPFDHQEPPTHSHNQQHLNHNHERRIPQTFSDLTFTDWCKVGGFVIFGVAVGVVLSPLLPLLGGHGSEDVNLGKASGYDLIPTSSITFHQVGVSLSDQNTGLSLLRERGTPSCFEGEDLFVRELPFVSMRELLHTNHTAGIEDFIKLSMQDNFSFDIWCGDVWENHLSRFMHVSHRTIITGGDIESFLYLPKNDKETLLVSTKTNEGKTIAHTLQKPFAEFDALNRSPHGVIFSTAYGAPTIYVSRAGDDGFECLSRVHTGQNPQDLVPDFARPIISYIKSRVKQGTY